VVKSPYLFAAEPQDLAFLGHPMQQPSLIIEPKHSLFHMGLHEIWQYRELLYFLIWRDVKVHYKQTVLGAGWAVLQPLVTMLIFTVVFGKFAQVSSDGLPYPIFAFTALLPWTYFAQAITLSGTSVVNSASLISKVYFPRLIVPISAAVVPFVNFAIAFVILLGMMVWFGTTPTWGILALPLFLCLSTATAVAVALWLSALNVRYRDVGYTIPFLVQCWMYVSPVAYPVSLVPESWRLVYSLNPMVGVIEGFRWALLGNASPHFGVMTVSVVAVLALLVTGVIYFKHMEQTFADVI
jgi:lipopolysaccharide transport system permease protein